VAIAPQASSSQTTAAAANRVARVADPAIDLNTMGSVTMNLSIGLAATASDTVPRSPVRYQ
jgi:hypothetical protein